MAYRSSAIATSASGGTITATPAGVVADDYLCALYVVDGNGYTPTPASGWTQRVLAEHAAATPDGHIAWVFDKDDATGSDAFGFTDDGATRNALITVALSGRKNSAPRTAVGTATINTTNNATPISASIGGVTAVDGDDILLWQWTDQVGQDDQWTYGAVTNYTERQDGVATAWVSGISLNTRDNVSAGATGSLASTITRVVGTASGAGYGGVVMAIAAAAAQPATRINFTGYIPRRARYPL